MTTDRQVTVVEYSVRHLVLDERAEQELVDALDDAPGLKGRDVAVPRPGVETYVANMEPQPDPGRPRQED